MAQDKIVNAFCMTLLGMAVRMFPHGQFDAEMNYNDDKFSYTLELFALSGLQRTAIQTMYMDWMVVDSYRSRQEWYNISSCLHINDETVTKILLIFGDGVVNGHQV